MQKEKQQPQPAFDGESEKQDFSWRKEGCRLRIKGEARISLAMGYQEAMGISKGRDGKAGTEAPKGEEPSSLGWVGLAGERGEVADTGCRLLGRLCVVSPGALCGWS